MMKKIWNFLMTYGLDRETLADITSDLAEGNLRYARIFSVSCMAGEALGMFSPLLVEKDPVKALHFLALGLPFLLLFFVTRRLQKSAGVTLRQVEAVTLLAMASVVAAHIYIGSISNPARPAVLYHAILLYTMGMFATRPIISIAAPVLATTGLLLADSVFKTPVLMY